MILMNTFLHPVVCISQQVIHSSRDGELFTFATFIKINLLVNIALRRFLHNHGYNIATERSPKPGLCPTLISNELKGFFIVHSTIGSTVHSKPLNSLEHCVCTATRTNIRPDRDSNLVPPGYEPSRLGSSWLTCPISHSFE